MNSALEYPFDAQYILTKRKRIKKELLASSCGFLEKRIAILGGSTTHDIKDILELFLLSHGIKPSFYESEYNQYWEDAVFDNEELELFKPDLVFIHTTNRNISQYPSLYDDVGRIEQIFCQEYHKFEMMWTKLTEKYACPIIQNNFEYPFYRLLGNKDASDIHGRIHYLTRLNMKFYEYAQSHSNFFIHDINYLSADYGLEKWSDPFYWHMYKYALCLPAIPYFAHSVACIMKSIYGKNKKAFALDLDNTLWGGVIGDDGVDKIEIGNETSLGQVYGEFQEYLKAHKELGVLLNVVSKNEEENALNGLRHPDGILKPEDFIDIKANWEPKSQNLVAIAEELSLLPESFVFVDDNPAEREIIRQQLPGTAVAELGKVEHYIYAIDRAGYFEVTNFSQEDLKRNEMYKENAQRRKLEVSFDNYHDYLLSLDMHADIKPFEAIHLSRIAQLTNKSNQFNLTTKRYTQEEIEAVANSDQYIDLSGRLVDKFGDNGIVSVVIGKKENTVLHMELWIMSCRVLKRDMEYAMMDELVSHCKGQGIQTIMGYYYPTAKNKMVKDFYQKQGFSKVSEDEDGNTVWNFEIPAEYPEKNTAIKV